MSDHRPIHLAALGGEINRRDLNTLIQRFLHLHRQRLQLLLNGLPPRQRGCLEILPLLFHCNHPALPGYGDGQAPAGISDYRISPEVRKAGKRLAPGFDHRSRGTPSPPIQALFLMGSAGTVAFSRNSDLDLWVCHRSDLDSGALAALGRKCQAIESWARNQGLELHCFLVDPQCLRQGELPPLSEESCGSTQHVLLLEEFYRTALHLAGKRLLWWLVPPTQEHRYQDYADFLLGKRFLDPEAIIDLGGLGHVPAGEFIGAGFWYLHKALNSPHKALLKLLLLLDYTLNYPQPRWLAGTIKQAVYAGQVDALRLDPYLQLYRRIENLVQQRIPALLSLVRHSLAVKIRDALHHPDYRPLLEELLRPWQLSPRPVSSQIENVMTEWQMLTYGLEMVHRELQRLAADTTSNHTDLQLLKRQWRAALEPRPGKITFIHLPISAEAILQLVHDSRNDVWCLRKPGRTPSLRQDNSLIALLAWSWGNGIANSKTQWQITQPTELSRGELQFLNRAVRDFFADFRKPELAAFRQPPRLRKAALFANIGTVSHPQRQGMTIASTRFDPLNYGAERRILFRNLEILSRSDWGETEVHRYQGIEGLLDALCWLHRQGGPELSLTCHCFSSAALARRIVELHRSLPSRHACHTIEIGGRHYRFHYRDGHLAWEPLQP